MDVTRPLESSGSWPLDIKLTKSWPLDISPRLVRADPDNSPKERLSRTDGSVGVLQTAGPPRGAPYIIQSKNLSSCEFITLSASDILNWTETSLACLVASTAVDICVGASVCVETISASC